MKKVISYAKEFFHRADIFLLVMGLICAIFGIVVISSATASYHSAKYVIVQSASLILGVIAFVVMTVLDVDVLADKWQILCAFNVVFLLLLWRLAKKHRSTEVICLVALTLYLFMENKPFLLSANPFLLMLPVVFFNAETGKVQSES